jgi:hypothetical protein
MAPARTKRLATIFSVILIIPPRARTSEQRPAPAIAAAQLYILQGGISADALIDVIFINTKDSSRLDIERRFGEDSAPDLFSTVRGCELHDQLGSERSLRILTIR